MKLSIISLLFTAVLANGLPDITGSCASDSTCCLGTDACLYAANNGGVATLESGSCDGETACKNAGRYGTGSATIEGNSCIGENSCLNAGRSGSFHAGDGSCTGERSCSQGGREDGSSLTVGAGSCIGQGTRERACDTAGMIGSAVIGAGSCIGDRTCTQIGREGTATVGDGSCLGFQSCFLAARYDGEVHIGDNSCTENRSCRAIGQSAVEELENGSIQIGNNACQCEGCCGCLKPGDVVPDGKCNALGEQSEECCTAVGDRNPFGPLEENNLCFDQQGQCRKATVSGDPHIRTFSGLKYDCMGQGEFILAKSQSETDPLEIRGLFVDPQFNGEADPWAIHPSPQTVTRGIAFKVDPNVPRIRVTTAIETGPAGEDICSLVFHVQDEGTKTRAEMLQTERDHVTISSNTNQEHFMRFNFGNYEADLTVRVSPTPRRWGCVMSFSSCLKEEFHGDVIGLFGTNNPYKDDDWTIPDGTQLVIPSFPKSRAGRGLSTDFCLQNYCLHDAPEDSFFSTDDYNWYSRCLISPYRTAYNEDLFEAMLQTLTEICDEEELGYNIPSEGLYDAALVHHANNQDITECPTTEIEEAITQNQIGTFNCQRTPEITPNTGGDPHFTTWKNEHFEYHGQCDLTLVKDEDFAGGLGLDIQIRTKVVRFWSYIKSVAIRIGNDILEIEGSADADDSQAHYWINYEYQGDLDEFAGFPVTQQLPSVYKRKYTIDMSSRYPGASISVQIYKEFVRVNFNGDQSVFGNTVGLLGDYKTGKTLSRDGVTEINDYSDLGDEWQVLPSEPKLFREASHPQFPEPCIKPEDPRGERARRLSESNITMEEAEVACSSLMDELSIKDCVYDILATQDLGMVGAF